MADRTEVLRPDGVFDPGFFGDGWWVSGVAGSQGDDAQLTAAVNDDSDSTKVAEIASGGGGTVGVLVLPFTFGTFVAPDGVIKSVRLRHRSSGTTNNSYVLSVTDTIGARNMPAWTPAADGVIELVTEAAHTTRSDGNPWTQADIDALIVTIPEQSASFNLINVAELYLDVVYNAKPTATVTAPTGTVSTTNRPNVTWSYADADSDTQTQYHVKIFTDDDVQAGGFDPDTFPAVWDSTATASAATTVQVADSLPANVDMWAYVRVNDGTQWSDWDTTASLFSISASGLDKPGRVFFAESSGPGSDGAGFWEFDDSNREGSFTFKSAPLRDPSGRQVEIREIQVYAKSYDANASVTVTVNGTARTETIAIPSRQQLSFRFRERGETLDVTVKSDAGNDATNEAPSIEAIRIGWRPGHQLH